MSYYSPDELSQRTQPLGGPGSGQSAPVIRGGHGSQATFTPPASGGGGGGSGGSLLFASRIPDTVNITSAAGFFLAPDQPDEVDFSLATDSIVAIFASIESQAVAGATMNAALFMNSVEMLNERNNVFRYSNNSSTYERGILGPIPEQASGGGVSFGNPSTTLWLPIEAGSGVGNWTQIGYGMWQYLAAGDYTFDIRYSCIGSGSSINVRKRSLLAYVAASLPSP